MLASRIKCDNKRFACRLEQTFSFLELCGFAASSAVTHSGHTDLVVSLEAFEVDLAANAGVLVFGFANSDQMHSHGSRVTLKNPANREDVRFHPNF
jgi:hypothetical protein